MKVTDASQIRALDLNRRAEAGRAQPAPAEASTVDRVSMEESARAAATAAEVARRAGTGDRAARLKAIEAAVRQGTYLPDPGRIAQQILNEAEIAARLQALLMR